VPVIRSCYTACRGEHPTHDPLMAEIKLAILSAQSLHRRIHDAAMLKAAVAAWEETRNSVARSVTWRLTTADGRHKLKHLCPSYSSWELTR